MNSSKGFCKKLGIEHPIFCGAMYPCSNPELVAAASEAGALGVIQPLSLVYAHSYELRAGIQKIKSLTSKPVAFNALIENSSKIYLSRMKKWVDIALEEGVLIYVSALGKPDWLVEKVHFLQIRGKRPRPCLATGVGISSISTSGLGCQGHVGKGATRPA